MKAIIYARVSTSGQEEKGFGFDLQISACQTLAKEKNIEVVEVIKEQVSGSAEIKDRKGILQLFETLKNNKIDYVIVYKNCRIARNLAISLFIEEQINKNGAKILSVLDPSNLEENAMSTAFKQISAVFSQLEKQLIVERLRAGRKAKFEKDAVQKNKKYTGAAFAGSAVSYGYKSENGNLVINDEYCEFIRDIVDRLQNQSLFSIVKELNRKIDNGDNVLKPKRGKYWYVSTLLYVLKNSTISASAKFWKQSRKGNHKPIISKKKQNEIIEILQSRAS
ncbi:recombinase family protein [Candidatus Dependentiae bacterium]|nr:recombinase family protein [Candidatus Dependentiae bacterium]